MNPADTLTNIFSHNLWANLRLLELCAGLTAEQLAATVPGTFGSIQETLKHMVLAEQSYFSRISTGRLYRHPEDAPPLTIAQMMELMRASGSGLVEWSAKVKADDTVMFDWEGSPRPVPKVVLLTQVINHATEHRSQIMTTLTQLGIQPPNLDSWTYFDQEE